MNLLIQNMGNRFRLIVNDVECIEPKPLPKLPVASALWIPMPNLEVGAGAWILAGGTHHSCFSYDLTADLSIFKGKIAFVQIKWCLLSAVLLLMAQHRSLLAQFRAAKAK